MSEKRVPSCCLVEAIPRFDEPLPNGPSKRSAGCASAPRTRHERQAFKQMHVLFVLQQGAV